MRPHGLDTARLLCSWNSSGKNTGVGCHFLIQGIFLMQGSNKGLLHCRQILLSTRKFSSVQSLSRVRFFEVPWTAPFWASLSITNSRSLLKLMFIESVMPSSHLVCCHPHLFPPSIFPSIKDFSNDSVLRIRCTKYWNFSFSISSNEYSGLISFRVDWLHLLAVQRTLKSLLQHHSSKVSILWCSAFLLVQLSHPYMTTGKTIALTRRTFVAKVMSLLFYMLSRLVITVFPRSKHLLISWLQSPSAVIWAHVLLNHGLENFEHYFTSM